MVCVIHHAPSVVKNLLYSGFSGILPKTFFVPYPAMMICFSLYTGCIMGGLVALGEV